MDRLQVGTLENLAHGGRKSGPALSGNVSGCSRTAGDMVAYIGLNIPTLLHDPTIQPAALHYFQCTLVDPSTRRINIQTSAEFLIGYRQ